MSCLNIDSGCKENTLDTTVDQWKQAIIDMYGRSDPGDTMKDISKKIDMGPTQTKFLIRQLVEEGKCKQGFAYKINSTGHRQRVPVYQLLGDRNA